MTDEDRPLPPLPTIEPGLYEHYKGQRYAVYAVTRHSETLEPLVLYRPLYGEGALWVRPYAMFTGTVETSSGTRPRFIKISSLESGLEHLDALHLRRPDGEH